MIMHIKHPINVTCYQPKWLTRGRTCNVGLSLPFCCRRTNTAPCGADKHPWYSNGASSKEPACQCRRHKRCAFDPWVGKIPLERAWQPTLVFLLGEPTDRGAWWAIANRVAESDRIEATQPTHNIKIPCSGTLLMVQWPRSPTPNAEDLGSILGQGTRSHMPELRSSVAKISKQLKKLPCSFFRYQSCLLPNCFSSVQSLSHVRLFATPWIAARQASLSITNSWSLLKLTSIESVMPSSHLILCCPLLLLPPIPASIRVFSIESTLCMRWPKCWSFSFSISPSNEHPGLISFSMDWLDLQSRTQYTQHTHTHKHQCLAKYFLNEQNKNPNK